jgi:hypothetical protein
MYCVVTPLLGTLFMTRSKIVNFLSDGDKKECRKTGFTVWEKLYCFGYCGYVQLVSAYVVCKHPFTSCMQGYEKKYFYICF